MSEAPQTAAPAPAVAPVATPEAAPAAPAPAAASEPAVLPADLQAAVAAHSAQVAARAGKPADPKVTVDQVVIGEIDAERAAAEKAAKEARPPEAAPGDEPAETEKKPEDEVPALQGQAKDEPVKEEPAAEPAKDQTADTLARYLEATRAARDQAKALKAEREALARIKEQATASGTTDAAELARFRELETLRKTDPVAATRKWLGEDVVRGNYALDLINRLNEDDGVQPRDPAKIAEEAATRAAEILKQQQEQERTAALERAKAEEAQRTEANKEAFFVGLQRQFQEDSEKYPYLAADPVPTAEIDQAVQAHWKATGQVPTPQMIFSHFEKIQENRAKKLLQVVEKRAGKVVATAKPAQQAPVATPAAAPIPRNGIDAGAKPTEARPSGSPTYKQEREEIIKRLTAQFGH